MKQTKRIILMAENYAIENIFKNDPINMPYS
jgi:hypothetical protein